MSEYKDIELRSEKVRNIIGKVPSIILRIGTFIISFLIILFLSIAYLVPFPQYNKIIISLYVNPTIQIGEASRSGIITINTNKTEILLDEYVGSLKTGHDSIIVYKAMNKGEILYNCDNGDYIEKGEVIFSIIPDSIHSIYGIFYITSDQMKIIQKGQEVEILLDEHSFMSKISDIYPISKTNNNGTLYKAKIDFHDISKEIKLYNDKDITGKILISKKPLLQRILNIQL
ncbi:HlyD family efflux transporter periplasmic adaptor subunit [Dysgonomonas termitidis]|uniref:HlyD family efflux transporter periplasmic adaptor subunit n=1 Tax=Dysgonomonas termitidis TaxID=1516126 RepID=A0ABV9KZL6_9BACT